MVHMHPQALRGAVAFLEESEYILKIMLSKFSYTIIIDLQWAVDRQPSSCPGRPKEITHFARLMTNLY